MGIFKSLTTIASTPIRCLGELGKDLSSLADDRKDESDGILSITTLGASSKVLLNQSKKPERSWTNEFNR